MRWNDRIGRRIKLSDLHVLLAVAQCGSMAKAANELAMSHPVVSRSIGELEHTLGVRLLERSPHGVELTEFGRAMLSRSNAAFDELRQGVKDIEFLAEPGVGEVRVGSTRSACGELRLDRHRPASSALSAHGVSRRDCRCRHGAARPGRAQPRLVDPARDRSLRRDRLNFEVLYDNPYCVVAGANNPWTRRRHVELAELIDEMWILPPPGERFGSLVANIFNAKGLPCPRASVVAYGLEMTVNLLGTGRYLAIQPEVRVDVSRPSIRSSGKCRSNCRSSAGRSEFSR